MRIAIAVILFAASTLAWAQSSIRVDGRVLQTGDNEGKVVQVLGRPDRVVTLETAFGGAVGERWTYYEIGDRHNSKSVTLVLRGGRLQSIEEARNR